MTIHGPVELKWWGDCIGAFNGSSWSGPQGVVSFDDVTAALKTFLVPNAMIATPIPVADIHPRVPNRIVNIDDVFVFIRAHQGAAYPFGSPGFVRMNGLGPIHGDAT